MNLTATATGRLVERVAHQITDAEQAAVTKALAAQDIHIALVVDVYQAVHLWAQQPTTTIQEVRALAAAAAVTDARLIWHPPTKAVTR